MTNKLRRDRTVLERSAPGFDENENNSSCTVTVTSRRYHITFFKLLCRRRLGHQPEALGRPSHRRSRPGRSGGGSHAGVSERGRAPESEAPTGRCGPGRGPLSVPQCRRTGIRRRAGAPGSLRLTPAVYCGTVTACHGHGPWFTDATVGASRLLVPTHFPSSSGPP